MKLVDIFYQFFCAVAHEITFARKEKMQMCKQDSRFSEQIILKLQELRHDLKVSIIETSKNNGVKLEGVCLSDEKCNVSPVVYLENYEHAYQNGKSLDDICDEILRMYEKHKIDTNFDTGFIMNFEQIKDRICFRMVNTERNEEYLENIPHKEFLNLSTVYFILLSDEEAGMASIVVQNKMMDIWGIELDELHELAIQNSGRELKGTVCDMQMALQEFFPMEADTNICEELENCSFSIASEGMGLYIISNTAKLHGAALMLYPNVLQKLAEMLESDLYILPSSTHELIALRCNDEMNPQELSNMVKTVNATEVCDEDFLSDEVYVYHRDSASLEIAA